MRNLSLKIQGNILESLDPLNLVALNIDIDFYKSSRGFYISSECNNANASFINEISFTNITAYNSVNRTVSTTGSLIYVYGGSNLTLTQSNISIYGSSQDLYPPIQFGTNTACNPNDGVVQTVTIINNTLSLNQINDNSRFTQIYSSIDSNYLRNITINVSYIIFNGVAMNLQPLLNLYANKKTKLFSSGFSISEDSFQDAIFYFSSFGQITLSSYSFEDILICKGSFIKIFGSLNTDINTLSITNCTLNAVDEYYYLEQSSNQGYLNITQFSMKNINLKDRKAIYTSGVPSFALLNSTFSNLTLNQGNSLIFTGALFELNIDSIIFSNIVSNLIAEGLNIMLNIDSFDLSRNTVFKINSIVITSSKVAFISFDKASNYGQAYNSFVISNFQYSDSYFDETNSLIWFDKLDLNTDFTILMINITFTNITFPVDGYLLNLRQQLKNPLTISNLTVSNVKNSRINIEAANSQLLTLPTQVMISSMNLNNINAGFSSFILLNGNSFLNITDSSIQYIYSFDSGSVMRITASNAQANIYNSAIQYNSAISGGLFLIENGGFVRVTNCSITYNFAIISGLINAQSNGYFELNNCRINSNSAVANQISQIFDVVFTPKLIGCSINSNTAITKSDVLSYMSNNINCGNICFLNQNYKTYLRNNPAILDQTFSSFLIQTISASVIIDGGSIIESQDAVVDSFVSNVTIQNTKIQNCNIAGVSIQITASTLVYNNIYSQNISSKNPDLPMIQVSLDSVMNLNNVTYDTCTAPLFNILSSSINMMILTLKNTKVTNYVLKFEQTTNATINYLTVLSPTSSMNNIMFSNAYIDSISNSYFLSCFFICAIMQNTRIRVMNKITIVNAILTGFEFLNAQIDMITNSNFMYNGVIYKVLGPIISFNSNMTIYNSSFSNNLASYGGGIVLSCKLKLPCLSVLNNVTFKNNISSRQGGAIYYDLYRPNMTNVIFINNTAPYGPNIASYPVKIVLANSNATDIVFNDVISGQEQEVDLSFHIVDYDNQLALLATSGRIVISQIIKGTSVFGRSTASIVDGVATFDKLIFNAPPGSKNIPFKISSTLIDSSKLIRQYGVDSIQNPIIVNFRFCKPGEYILNDQCNTCVPRTYSLNWNSTKCNACIDHADCLGGEKISVDSGYWRKSTNSTYIIECPRSKSCKGGFHPENEYPVECNTGYSGLLCTECVTVDGQNFEQQSGFECSLCPNAVYNALRIVGLILLVSIFFVILIIVNIRKKNETQQSILLRILANYFQLLTVALSFDMKFPSVITESFYPVQKLGSSSEVFLSLNCFFKDAKIVGFTPSTAIFKTFLSGILPLILIGIGIASWDFSRNVAITTIVIIYLLHPTLTKVGLQLFQCIKVDEGVYKVKLDLNIDCYSYVHIKWCMIIGVPIIVLWVIACPVLVFWILFKNRKSLREVRIQRYLLILYQGLKDKCFFWELVNTLRKISMVCINVFMSTLNLIYSGTIAVIILIGFIRLQKKLNPYKDPNNNALEMDAMVTGTATLFCGMMFVNDSNNLAGIAVLLMIVIFILNLKFLIHWTFYMSFTLAGKYKLFYTIFMVIGMILCKRAQAEKMLEKEGISYKIPKDDISTDKIENSKEIKAFTTTFKKKTKNKLKQKRRIKFEENKEDQISPTKAEDFVTVSNFNYRLHKATTNKDFIIESCSPNKNEVTLAFGLKPSLLDIVEESSSDVDRIHKNYRKKKSKKHTNKSKYKNPWRSSKRINPMTDAVFEETFDNYIPDSRNQMISIDDRIRSIRKEVLETDD